MVRGIFHLLATLLLLTACGKVGDPLPPFIRIPESIQDLAVQQSGHDFILTWTNPARNIDGSAATDLADVHILSNGSEIVAVHVNAPGRMQSHAIPIDSLGGVPPAFSVQVETARGKMSAVSNTVSIMPVEVPGRVEGIHALVDQRRVTLSWEKPSENPNLADAYVVIRTEPRQEPATVFDTRYEDNRYVAGAVYTYQVTAMRRIDQRLIPGVASQPISVRLEDKTAPRPPSRLDVVPSDTGAFVTWAPNAETDLAGYRVFRSEEPDRDFESLTERPVTTNAFFDPEYRPGLYYAVSALDDSGNESARSMPFHAP